MTKAESIQPRSVLLVGGPDAGKSNFLGRLWMALDQGRGLITKNGLPSQMEYLRSLAESLLQGEFAPHTSHGVFQDNVIPVRWMNGSEVAVGQLVVPDCAGEQWERIHQMREWTEEWEATVRTMTGCLLFVRANTSHFVPALDWATAGSLLGCLAGAKNTPAESSETKLPTQVVLVDWLECLYSAFKEVHGPCQPLRLSVIVSAWDKVTSGNGRIHPDGYIDENLPLLYDFLSTNARRFATQMFGVSVVGGDLSDAQPGFKETFLEGDPYSSGDVVYSDNGRLKRTKDFTIPLGWALGCPLGSSKSTGVDSK